MEMDTEELEQTVREFNQWCWDSQLPFYLKALAQGKAVELIWDGELNLTIIGE